MMYGYNIIITVTTIYRDLLLGEIDREERERCWFFSQLEELSQKLAQLPRIDTVRVYWYNKGYNHRNATFGCFYSYMDLLFCPVIRETFDLWPRCVSAATVFTTDRHDPAEAGVRCSEDPVCDGGTLRHQWWGGSQDAGEFDQLSFLNNNWKKPNTGHWHFHSFMKSVSEVWPPL